MAELHALIIDDNAKNVQVLAHMLDTQGISYTNVIDSTTIDHVLQSIGQVDIIFLDLEMPAINGFEVLERMIKPNPQFRNVPVVAYSVHVSEVQVALQQGFHSFLGKPLNTEKFPDLLARILQGERVWSIA